jgi:hypothetical protein
MRCIDSTMMVLQQCMMQTICPLIYQTYLVCSQVSVV